MKVFSYISQRVCQCHFMLPKELRYKFVKDRLEQENYISLIKKAKGY